MKILKKKPVNDIEMLLSHTSPKPAYHIIKRSEGWAVRKTGNTRATQLFKNIFLAFHCGFKLAKRYKTQFVIHKPSGAIRFYFDFTKKEVPTLTRDGE